MISKILSVLWLPALLLILFMAAVLFRPLLPIDETRYMSVAWEMLHHGWLHPLTMNQEPYHHKPPLLFWLVNLSWAAFGVSRWAGLVPVVAASCASVFLTASLGRLLFPEALGNRNRTMLVMAASVPFMVYSTLVLFDLTLAVFVLLSLISLLLFARRRNPVLILGLGLGLGLGVLTKGPVAYLYVLFPMLLAPFWMKDFKSPAYWYAAMFFSIAISLLPVLFWLVPVLRQSDGDFAFWLVWNQTAGRVTGNFSDAHSRPFFFYLPLLPVMMMPWIFYPSFWRGMAGLARNEACISGKRFLLCWLLPVFLSFSLISGKQPHYLVPLLPGMVLAMTLALQALPTKIMVRTLTAMTALLVGGQIVAAQHYFRAYDLEPLAAYLRTHPGHDLAFVRNYHAEFGFIARLTAHVHDMQTADIPAWFEAHPDGLAIIRYKDISEVSSWRKLMEMPYRGKKMGIFSSPDTEN